MAETSTARRTYRALRAAAALRVLKVLGWRFETTHTVDLVKGEIDRLPKKFVVFGEPHTHWHDFLLMLLFFWAYRLPTVRFPVRHVYFYPVLSLWLRWMGAIPVDTSRHNGLVAELVELIRNAEELILHIAPSGTRKRTEYWRSGFYHIARLAEVPVFMAYLDASTKTFGFGAQGEPQIYWNGTTLHGRGNPFSVDSFEEDLAGFADLGILVCFLSFSCFKPSSIRFKNLLVTSILFFN